MLQIHHERCTLKFLLTNLVWQEATNLILIVTNLRFSSIINGRFNSAGCCWIISINWLNDLTSHLASHPIQQIALIVLRWFLRSGYCVMRRMFLISSRLNGSLKTLPALSICREWRFLRAMHALCGRCAIPSGDVYNVTICASFQLHGVAAYGLL